MRILVVAAFEAGSQYAHAINTAKMAHGFARIGHEVTMLCKRPPSSKRRAEELSATYAVSDSIKWIQAPSSFLGRLVGEDWDFAGIVLAATLVIRPQLIFARNYIAPYLTSLFGFRTVAETHTHPDNGTKPFLQLLRATAHKQFRRLITISESLAESYRSSGVPPEKILVMPTGADTEFFCRPEVLPKSPYPMTSPVIAYVGHLYDYKGIPTILEAAAMLPELQFHFIGGFPEDVERQTERAGTLRTRNVHFHGMKPHHEVPPYLWHADVLLLTPSARHPSARWTSPVKLGEYLASGTPVIATSVPALTDFLTEEEVKFVEPDNASSLVDGIRDVLNDKSYAYKLSQRAVEKAFAFSYEVRAREILGEVNKGLEKG